MVVVSKAVRDMAFLAADIALLCATLFRHSYLIVFKVIEKSPARATPWIDMGRRGVGSMGARE